MNLLNNVYRRWNVTRRKLTLGHQSRKWYITVRFCALEYLTDCVFVSPVVAVGPASQCWMELFT